MSSDPTERALRWRRRKEARPKEILAAALALFAERGFAATRLDDVALRAGVTKGTLYLYFPNKEELFEAVVRQALVPNLERGEALLDEADEPAALLLERLMRSWAELALSPAGAIPKIIISEAGNFPELARFYREEVVDRGIGLMRRVLRLGVERGEFRAPRRPRQRGSLHLCAAAARNAVAPFARPPRGGGPLRPGSDLRDATQTAAGRAGAPAGGDGYPKNRADCDTGRRRRSRPPARPSCARRQG